MRQTKTYTTQVQELARLMAAHVIGMHDRSKGPDGQGEESANWPNLPTTIIAASAISALAIYLSFGIR